MRIALFSGNYNYLREGANQALNILVRFLEGRASCTVRVYSPVTDTPAFEPEGTLVPVPSIALPVRGEFRLALGLPRTVRDDIREFRPDIVHVSTPDILGFRAQTFAKTLGVPVVASMHTRFEKYLAYYRLGWAQTALQAHLNRFYKRSDHVVAPTSALVDDLRAMRGDDRVSVWGRGVDTVRFDPAKRDMPWRRSLGLADDDIAILFLGRLVMEKGISAFTAAMHDLQQRDQRIRPLVVGAGPAAHAFDGLAGAVLTGHLSGPALATAIASADIMFCPSTTETFGNVLLEATACGLPIVSADAQNARSILKHGDDSLICALTDACAYGDALARLSGNEALRRAMGSAARRNSLGKSWDAESQKVVQVYRSLLGR